MPIRIRLIVTMVFLSTLCAFSQVNATDYSLKDLDGNTHRTSELRGKWLVMNFWATWCAPCIHEMPELERFYRNQRDTAEVWGVTFEDNDIATIKSFIKKLGVSYPILGHGQDPKTGYGFVTGLPTTFIINPEGKLHHKFVGPITEADIVGVINKPQSQP